jgi:hypothetical protein
LLGIPFAFLGWYLFVRKQRGRQILLMISWISLFYLISKRGIIGMSGILIVLGVMLLMVVHEIIQAGDHKHTEMRVRGSKIES